MLMGSGDRGVDRDDPLQVRDRVGVTLQLEQHPIPGAVLGPPVETPPDRLPGREIAGQVPPRRPGPEPPADRLDHRTMLTPPPTPSWSTVREQRLDPIPHLI